MINAVARKIQATLSGRLVESVDKLSAVQGGSPLRIRDVSAALKRNGVPHVLVGGHVMGALTGIPRATQDIDIVVGSISDAEDAISHHLPSLVRRRRRGEDVTRYNLKGVEVLNLLHPHGLFQLPLIGRNNKPATLSDGTRIRIPTLPVAIAMKTASYHSPYRDHLGKLRDDADVAGLMAAHLRRRGSPDDVMKHLTGSSDTLLMYKSYLRRHASALSRMTPNRIIASGTTP